MRTPDELQALIAFAKEQGMPWIEVDGVKMPVPIAKPQYEANPESPEIPSDPTSDYTEEEILFYSTPYFDEIQAAKEAKKKALDDEKATR